MAFVTRVASTYTSVSTFTSGQPMTQVASTYTSGKYMTLVASP